MSENTAPSTEMVEQLRQKAYRSGYSLRFMQIDSEDEFNAKVDQFVRDLNALAACSAAAKETEIARLKEYSEDKTREINRLEIERGQQYGRAEAATSRAAALVEALRRYGKHPASCPKGVGIGLYKPAADAICNCGIDDALLTQEPQ